MIALRLSDSIVISPMFNVYHSIDGGCLCSVAMGHGGMCRPRSAFTQQPWGWRGGRYRPRGVCGVLYISSSVSARHLWEARGGLYEHRGSVGGCTTLVSTNMEREAFGCADIARFCARRTTPSYIDATIPV